MLSSWLQEKLQKNNCWTNKNYIPDFVVHFLVFEYFQGSHLIEYFRFVEADQVMDYYIWGPNVLKQESQTLFTMRGRSLLMMVEWGCSPRCCQGWCWCHPWFPSPHSHSQSASAPANAACSSVGWWWSEMQRYSGSINWSDLLLPQGSRGWQLHWVNTDGWYIDTMIRVLILFRLLFTV